MRQEQRRIVAAHVAVRDEVEVERAVAPPLPALAPVPRLDRVQVRQQHGRGQPGGDEGDGVQVRRGRGIRSIRSHGDRFDGGRRADGVDERQTPQIGDRLVEHRGAIAEVGAQGDDGFDGRTLDGVIGSAEAFRETTAHEDSPASAARRMVTETSANGTVMGACGLWMVTLTIRT